MIEKLSQEVINQIAAGEVVERPASVAKELLDNAIDAKSSKIDIKLKGGGKKKIEVSDNGVGIEKEDLKKVFEAHTTSKIRKIEDLGEALTMGFRGEALPTILSVSQISLKSKYKDDGVAYEIQGGEIEITEPKEYPREVGTTIIVENLFTNIPAREKYLRTDNTEYRRILDTLLPYFLIYPNIQFTLFNNDKKVYSLPQIQGIKTGEISQRRIKDILKDDFAQDMLKVFYDGEGMRISGFVASPEHVYDKTRHQYFFLNNRPVYDSGVVKAVLEAFSGFIPSGKKIPFILHLEIKPSLVDVNVHPRKEEVRFINPFRVYSAFEECIKQSLKDFSYKSVSLPEESFTQETYDIRDKPKKNKKEVYYGKSYEKDVNSGIKFSEHLLRPNVVKQENNELFKDREEDFSCFQIFNKYILVNYEKEVWFVDQHAASERINYEKITSNVNIQDLLVPENIELSEKEIAFLKDNVSFLEEFGFKVDLNENILEINSMPSILFGIDLKEFFKEVFADEELYKNLNEIKENVTKLIACHGSIRTGQKLSEFEIKELIKDLRRCENSFSCPHGRPIIWKLKIEELDKNFYR